MNEEMIKKAKEAKSVEELLTLAKENNIVLTEEQAKEYYDRLHVTGELADDELDNVAGGGCGEIKCPKCGSTNLIVDCVWENYGHGFGAFYRQKTKYTCKSCHHCWQV